MPQSRGYQVYSKYMQTLSQDIQTSIANSTKVAEEVISSMATVRSFANEPNECRRFDIELEEFYRHNINQGFGWGTYVFITTLLPQCVTAAVRLVSDVDVDAGASTPDASCHASDVVVGPLAVPADFVLRWHGGHGWSNEQWRPCQFSAGTLLWDNACRIAVWSRCSACEAVSSRRCVMQCCVVDVLLAPPPPLKSFASSPYSFSVTS